MCEKLNQIIEIHKYSKWKRLNHKEHMPLCENLVISIISRGRKVLGWRLVCSTHQPCARHIAHINSFMALNNLNILKYPYHLLQMENLRFSKANDLPEGITEIAWKLEIQPDSPHHPSFFLVIQIDIHFIQVFKLCTF